MTISLAASSCSIEPEAEEPARFARTGCFFLAAIRSRAPHRGEQPPGGSLGRRGCAGTGRARRAAGCLRAAPRAAGRGAPPSSEGRRGGKEWVRTGRSRGAPDQSKKKKKHKK